MGGAGGAAGGGEATRAADRMRSLARGRDPPAPRPGGSPRAEVLYCVSASQTFASGNRMVHGAQCEVMGPPCEGAQREGYALSLLFPGNAASIACQLEHVSREPPSPLPGGFKLGERVYFVGASQTFSDGVRIVHGAQGEVMGPATSSRRTQGQGLSMKFPGNQQPVGCFLKELSKSEPPPLPQLRPCELRLQGLAAEPPGVLAAIPTARGLHELRQRSPCKSG